MLVDPRSDAQIAQEFLAEGREFVKRFPDFNETLNDADARGLILSPTQVREIARMKRPDVVYHLATQENHAEAHSLMDVKEEIAFDKLHRIAAKLDAQGTYKKVDAKERAEDEYIRQRRQDIRSGKRRR